MQIKETGGYVTCQKEMENHFACPEQKDVTVVPEGEIYIVKLSESTQTVVIFNVFFPV